MATAHSKLIELKKTSDINKGYILDVEIAKQELSVYLNDETGVNPFKNMNILTTWFDAHTENNAFLQALLSMKNILQWNTIVCMSMENGTGVKTVYGNDGSKTVRKTKWTGAYANDSVFERELKKCDVVLTCDSYFYNTLDLIKQSMQKFKKFIILGGKLLVISREVYQMIENNEMWLGGLLRDVSTKFYVSDDYDYGQYYVDDYGRKYVTTTNDRFYTNIHHDYRQRDYVNLVNKFSDKKYKACDNFPVLNVECCKDIPYDFKYPMAVPSNVITHLDADGKIRFRYYKENKAHIVSYVLEGNGKTVPMNATSFNEGGFEKVLITQVSDVIADNA